MRKLLSIVIGVLATTLSVIGLAIVIVAILATHQPSTYSVERTTVIAAPPHRILPLVDDFHNFKLWSPWQHLDPNMTVTFSGAPSGPGAIYQWHGNSKAGTGRMEILSTTPTQTVVKLDFLKPMESHNTTTYTLTPQGPTTQVTWSMSGPTDFPTKLMTVFYPMDKMVGPDFDRGLANLKAAAEGNTKQ